MFRGLGMFAMEMFLGVHPLESLCVHSDSLRIVCFALRFCAVKTNICVCLKLKKKKKTKYSFSLLLI